MKKYFDNPKSLNELKKQYRNLAMQFHPDRPGGSTEAMQRINNEYDLLFEKLKNIHETAEGFTYESASESAETPEMYKSIINRLINLEGLEIEICGSWIWVTGNTRIYKEELKSIKFRWSKNKCAWYFHGEDYHKFSKKSFTLDEIRNMYGSAKVDQEPQAKIN